MNVANNLRFQETDRKIKNTVLALLQEYQVNKITVRMICEESGVNRSTFYAHFLDVYDLMNKLQLDIYADIEKTFSNIPINENKYITKELMTVMIDHIGKNRLFYRAYMSYGSQVTDPAGETLYQKFMVPFFHSLGFKDSADEERKMRYHFRFFYVGMIEVLRIWLEADCPETPEELSYIILDSIADPKECFEEALEKTTMNTIDRTVIHQ